MSGPGSRAKGGDAVSDGLLWLVSFYDSELKQRIAFVVRATSRDQAKRLVRDFANSSHWQLDPDTRVRSNLLDDSPVIRIDHLIY